MIDFDYKIIRSARRSTVGITIKPDGSVEVRIPLSGSVAEAEKFLSEKQDWVRINRKKVLDRRTKSDSRDWDRVRMELYPWIRSGGRRMFAEKVDYWARRMGVQYNRIAIKDLSSRWGSCSAKHNLNFSWKVFVMPERLVNYLVVHELAHIKHMDHSPRFWAVVASYIPDYKIRKKEFENYV